jgi:ribonuclease T1
VVRARLLCCILSAGVFLGGCDRNEPRSSVRESVAPASQASVAVATSEAVEQRTSDGMAVVRAAELPRQAATTLRLIEAGGPFPYEKDGVVFGNRERLLPRHSRGYYHEYTVPTPRSRDRGARRIVCGGAKQQIGDCYYSDDHYASFKRIAG